MTTCRQFAYPHPIFVQQPVFVNIYTKLQEYIGVTKSRKGEVFQFWPLDYTIIDFNLKRSCSALGNFADTSYFKENFTLRLLSDVCTLYARALACNSMLHVLL